MYFRMLKKDLRDKVGLNIVLFIFMIIASTLLVVSSGFIYTFLKGSEDTYEKCNTSDLILVVERSFSDEEGQREKITQTISQEIKYKELIISDILYVTNSRLDFEGVDKRSVSSLYEGESFIAPVSGKQNIPYDMNDERFVLQDGCVALPQSLSVLAGSKPGDKFRITTDMGNKYEFTVSHIYKDPATAVMNKILVSDGDYRMLLKEFPAPAVCYEGITEKSFGSLQELLRWGTKILNEIYSMSDSRQIDGGVLYANPGKVNIVSDHGLVSVIISVFMGLIGVLMIGLIFMTIRFSLRATVKREEKEIGMMKAIGVDSLFYRSLFIVKYIAFAVTGAVLGLIIGIPVSRYMISSFIVNTINLSTADYILIGLLVTVLFIGLMILFSFISLNRINKISVMDTIHGENKGERFSKIPGLSLYKHGKIPIPLFLSLNDISGRLKRYITLILSFTMGIVSLLMLFQLKDTIVSDSFRRNYWMVADREVFIRPDEKLRDKLINREGSGKNLFLYYEKFFNENKVPLNIQIFDVQNASAIVNGETYGIHLNFGDVELERLKIVEGGNIPKLENEVAIQHDFALKRGIKIGDAIDLEYKVYGEDGFSTVTKNKAYLVTAFVETVGLSGFPDVVMAKSDGYMPSDDWDLFNEGIDADGKDYDAAIEKMRSLMPDAQIWDYDQLMDYDLGNQYGRPINILIVVFSFIMSITFLAMTFLYEQIFIEDETSDIAILKSMGFDGKTIGSWQYLRIILLVISSSLIAVAASFTISRYLLGALGKSALSMGSFLVAAPSPLAMMVVPLGLLVIVTAALLISFKTINGIEIWRIRDE